MPPIRSLPLPSDVLKQASFTSLQERMSKDLFAFDAEQRKNDDALSLENIGNLHLPEDASVTGTTGYEGMLGDTEAPDAGGAAPETPDDYGAATEAPRRTTGLMSPTLDMPAMLQPRQQPVYDPTQTIDIQGEPDYDPSADMGTVASGPPNVTNATLNATLPGTGAPAIAGKFPEEQARIYQQAKASGLDDEGARVMVSVSETEGGARGAVGDNGHARGVYQFHDSGEFPNFVAWVRKNGIEGDPAALAVDPEVSTRYAAEGYLGQAIKRGRELGYSGAELATYVQRTGQRSVQPETTGENYTRLFGQGAAASNAPNATPNATLSPTQRAAESRNEAGETRLSRVSYPLQQDLTDPDKWAVCGPLAAMAMASANGTPIDYETAKAKARAAGWSPAGGMAGPSSQVALLNSVGVPTHMEAVNWEKVQADVRNGNPVTLSSPGGSGHYFVVQGVDDQGRLDLGNSALTLKGGRRWMTPGEMRALGPIGAVDTAIYMDNPSSPTPSRAAAETGQPSAAVNPNTIIRERDALALTAGAVPADSPPAPPAGTAPPPAGGSPLDAARTQNGGGGLMLKDDGAGIVPVRDRWADEPQAPAPPARDDWRTEQPLDPDQGPHELIPPGAVSAPPIISPLAPNENPGVSTTASQPAPPQIQITQGGPPTPSAQFTEMPIRPTPAAPAPQQLPVWDAQGNVIGYRQDEPPAPPPDQSWRGAPLQTGPALPQSNADYIASQATGGGTVNEFGGNLVPQAPQSNRTPVLPPAHAITTPARDDWRVTEPKPSPYAQPAPVPSAETILPGRVGHRLDELVSNAQHAPSQQLDPGDILDIVGGLLPTTVVNEVLTRQIDEKEWRRITGTDPLAPFRPAAARIGVTLPSAEEVNPDGFPAISVWGGLAAALALPDPTDPLATRVLGTVGRGAKRVGVPVAGGLAAAAFGAAQPAGSLQERADNALAAGASGFLTSAAMRHGAGPALRAAEHVAPRVVEAGQRIGRALDANAGRAADEGVQHLGSGFVPEGSGRTIGRGGAPMEHKPLWQMTEDEAVQWYESQRGIRTGDMTPRPHKVVETADQFQETLAHYQQQGVPVFQRSTGNIQGDIKRGYSMNYQTGRPEGGISVNEIDPIHQDRGTLASLVQAQDFYQANVSGGKPPRLYLLTGDVVGHGGDGEPVLNPSTIRVLGEIKPGAELADLGEVAARVDDKRAGQNWPWYAQRNAVQAALERGEMVPPAVLAQWPQLAEKFPQAFAPRGEPPPRPLTNAGRAADEGVQHLGSGFVPEPQRGRPTVEMLQEQLSAAQRAAQSARRFGDDVAVRQAQDEAARIESDLVDAMNARRNLEPAITSDVGRRIETLPLPEETADTFSGAGSRPGATRPEDLSGPVSHVPSQINLNAGFGAVPDQPRRAPSSRQVSPPPLGAPSPAMEAVDAIKNADLVTPERMVSLIGDRPEYLADVAQHILAQRRKVIDGNLTPRDTAKAYYMTVASQGSDAIGVDLIKAKTGFDVPERFWSAERRADGLPVVRPEEAAAAWLFSPRGQEALNDIERGVMNRKAWAEGAAVRRAFGDDRFRTNNVFSERAPVNGRTQFNMDSIGAFTDRFNEAARSGATPAELMALSKRLNGISEAKGPFLNHALGFGESPTVDAVEISAWLTGQGDVSRLQGKAAALKRQIDLQLKDKRVGAALGERVGQQFAAMRQLLPPEATADLPDEVFNHVLHHWIWDRMKGTATTHEGFYDALRNASGLIPTRATAFNAAQGGVLGAASEDLQAQEEGREPDPTSRLVRGVVGAGLGIAAGRHAGRRVEGRLGSGVVPGNAPSGGGSLFDHFPDAAAWYRRAKAKNAAEMKAGGITAPSKGELVRGTVGTVGYGSMLGPGTAAFNVAAGLMQPIWATAKEPTRAVVRAIGTRNPEALREPAAAAGGALIGLGHVGEALWDVIRARGKYAPSPDAPNLSQRIADPIGRGLMQALETPGRVWSGGPDAVFGTVAQYAVEARRAAQLATDAGHTGQKWKDWFDLYMKEAERVRSTNAPAHQIGAGTADVLQAGEKAAEQAGYRQPLGSIGQQARKLARLGDFPVVGSFVAPFFNGPWNIHLQALERTPAGFAMNTQASKFDKYYDAIVGSAAVIGLAEMGRQGAVTVNGSGPIDQNERQAWMDRGNRPYSLQAGGVQIPTRAFAGAELLLNAVGEYLDAQRFPSKNPDDRKVTEETLSRIGRLIKQYPYSAGYATIADTIQFGLPAAGADLASRLTPGAATMRAIGTALDPSERTVDRGAGVSMLDEGVQRYQQATGFRSGLPVAQNILGEPKENPQRGPLAFIGRFGFPKDDPVIQVFQDVRAFPSDPPRDIRGVMLTPGERRQWDAYRGEALRELVPDIADSVKDEAPDVREKALRNAFTTASRIAQGRLIESMGDQFDTRLEATLEKAGAGR